MEGAATGAWGSFTLLWVKPELNKLFNKKPDVLVLDPGAVGASLWKVFAATGALGALGSHLFLNKQTSSKKAEAKNKKVE